MLTDTVFATMSLEDQQVPKHKVQEIVLLVLEENDLKSGHFTGNKVA